MAIKVRNQANMVIGYHLGPSPYHAESGESCLINTVARQCRTFIDVGANVGNWTAAFRIVAPQARGLLFDPSCHAIATLEKRFRGVSDLEIVEAAAGNCAGSMTFYEGRTAHALSSLAAPRDGQEFNTRTVPVTTVDAEVAKRSWNTVDFLKVDAEGYDFKVLQGATGLVKESRIGFIQFEYNRPWALVGDTLTAAVESLKGYGYSVYLLHPSGLFRLDYERYGEYYSYSNYVAVAPHRLTSVSRLLMGGI